jgi:hypothetical protein
MTLRALLLAALALPALAVIACNSGTMVAADKSTVANPGGPDSNPDASGGEALAEPDAASEAQPATTLVGSPLCNAGSTSCFPDHPTTAKACALAPDGGPYNPMGDYDNAALACRVVSAPANGSSVAAQAPQCVPAGSAGDGSWCKSSSECLPGFDCVGAGTCQHYCCSGNTECVADQFCDIQATVEASSIEVPVCMPIHPAAGCKLLDSAACPPAQTCAVVRDDGSTSCVAVGGAKAGQECDTDHCAAGLACLGATGQRVCYQLCPTSTSEGCSAKQQCQGGLPLFPDPAVGICQ